MNTKKKQEKGQELVEKVELNKAIQHILNKIISFKSYKNWLIYWPEGFLLGNSILWKVSMTSFTIVWAFDTPAGPIKKGTSYRKHCKHYHLVDVVKAQQQQLQIFP